MTSRVYSIRPILLFVVLPLIFALLSNYLPVDVMPRFSFPTSVFPSSVESYFASFLSSSYWISLGIILLMTIMVYSFYHSHIGDIFNRLGNSLGNKPLIDSEFFDKWGREDAIAELKYIEGIAYIGIPVLIFLVLIYLVGISNPDLWENHIMKFFGNISLLRMSTVIYILSIFWFPLSLFFIIILSKSFQFYLAKSCFIVAKNKAKRLDKIRYCLSGLNAYNKFLARYASVSLDKSKVYTKILSSTSLDVNVVIDSFDDKDNLKPIIQFVALTGSDELVSPLARLQVLKELVQFLLALLPIVVAIFAALLPTYSRSLRAFFGQ